MDGPALHALSGSLCWSCAPRRADWLCPGAGRSCWARLRVHRLAGGVPTALPAEELRAQSQLSCLGATPSPIGSLSLAEVAGELDRETLQRLKRECGGLQTLLRNSPQVFQGEARRAPRRQPWGELGHLLCFGLWLPLDWKHPELPARPGPSRGPPTHRAQVPSPALPPRFQASRGGRPGLPSTPAAGSAGWGAGPALPAVCWGECHRCVHGHRGSEEACSPSATRQRFCGPLS